MHKIESNMPMKKKQTNKTTQNKRNKNWAYWPTKTFASTWVLYDIIILMCRAYRILGWTRAAR